MKQIQPLQKMRSVISADGRLAQFFLLFKGGQNTAFSIPFHKIGMLISAIRGVAKSMHQRLSTSAEASTAELLAGLSDPAVVNAVAASTDATTGDTLLCIETAENGSFSFQLNEQAFVALSDTLREHELSSNPHEGRLNYA